MHDYERAYKYLQSESKFDPVYAAIDAVKKQIPIKVVESTDFDICPSCAYKLNKELINVYRIKHCPFCGQAIKKSRGS
ncbi:MAG: hypothetical protein A2Y15_08640 [Clostridiales bacterium GWF2_36_10]|nr:MAG: hypothetical protein A2Y15_08640 [Clostridiales bacterium GWF2_36_10]